MSMISGLIDELNKSADEWNGSNMFELARMCREAADTITELHGALQVASVDYRHLQDENAKLRKLVARMADALGIDSEWADPNWCKSNCVLEFWCRPEEERTDILCPAWAAMRELGVEVDG